MNIISRFLQQHYISDTNIKSIPSVISTHLCIKILYFYIVVYYNTIKRLFNEGKGDNMTKNDLLLYRIAHYYYINNYSQDEISKRENISRPQISRLLKQAREKGLVHIDVSLPDEPKCHQQEQQLIERYGFVDVVVSPSSPDQQENDKTLYLYAADYLSTALERHKNIGLGWGKTIYNTAISLTYTAQTDNMCFYPIIGSSGTSSPYLQINSICDRFAEKFHAKAYFNNYLAIIPQDSENEIIKERLNLLKNQWRDLDALVIGLGGKFLEEPSFVDEFPKDTLKVLQKSNITGEILLHFFCKSKNKLYHPNKFITNTIDLENIRLIDNVYALAHGQQKVEIIKFAVKKGYINTLITDSLTAAALLADDKANN